MKKFSTLLLSGALVLSTAIPAFAAGTEAPTPEYKDIETVEAGAQGSSVTSESLLELPTIKVTLPTTHGFIINPYNLDEAGQIVSAEATIKNESSLAVEVNLKSATAIIAGTKKAVLGTVTDTTTTKTVELNLNVTSEDEEVTIHPVDGVVNINGKNKDVKLVDLPATTGVATLKYDGKVVANPVGSPWEANDKVTVTSVYTFTPVGMTSTPEEGAE